MALYLAEHVGEIGRAYIGGCVTTQSGLIESYVTPIKNDGLRGTVVLLCFFVFEHYFCSVLIITISTTVNSVKQIFVTFF